MIAPLPSLDGKRILITSGRILESIDGVRLYANHRRPAYQGHAVAAFLSDHGAHVSLITPSDHAPCLSQNILVHPCPPSREGMVHEVQTFLASHPCDALLCLACVPSIRPAQQASQKLKIKNDPSEPVLFTVTGMSDLKALVHDLGLPVLGFDVWQERFSTEPIPPWLEAYAPFVWDAPPLLSAPEADPFPITSSEPPLAGKTVLMTSGPTAETLTTTGDVITNASSGRQGSALATALAQRGAIVRFVTGDAEVMPSGHPNIHMFKAFSAKDMLQACLNNLPADIFIGVAAVADFGSDNPVDLRLGEDKTHTLTLRQKPDILKTIGTHTTQRPSVVIGFAAETDPDALLDYATKKCAAKNADMICANVVGTQNELSATQNQLLLVRRNAPPKRLDVMSKRQTADVLVDVLATML